MKRKLNSDQTLLHEFDKIFKDYLNEGIIEEVKVNENDITSAHYLTHHAVIKTNRETSKTRIVFDASAKLDKNEPSLNDILYSGPCLLPLIENILLRFRLGKIALVNECHRNYLKILWYDNLFDENSLKIYRFARILFGLICSPFLLNGTVKEHVKKHINFANQTILEKLLRDLYVDDAATSFNSIDDASEFYTITSTIMKKGAFNLRKWESNDDSLNQVIKNSDQQKRQNDIRKVLGLNWNNFRDEFQFEFTDLVKLASELPATKRNIFKVTAMFYDPLGLISPIVLQSKLIYQSLCKEKLTWDTIVPEPFKKQWDTFIDKLRYTEKVIIPRSLLKG